MPAAMTGARRPKPARRLSAARAAGAGIVIAALHVATPAAAQPSPTERTVFALMQCHECNEGELRNVIALGATAVPLLRTILLEGPPAAHVARVQGAIVAIRRPPGIAPLAPSDTAVVAQVQAFRTMYRVRAAVALGAINTPAAREALCAGRSAGVTTTAVRGAIDVALGRIGAVCG